MDEERKAKKYCPLCNKVMEEPIVDVCTEAYRYVIERIKDDHPDWVEEDGACPKCWEFYKKL